MRAQTLNVTTPAPRKLWRDLLKLDPEALVSQTPAWTDCLCAMGCYTDVSRLYETSKGKQMILPIVRRKGLLSVLSTESTMPLAWGIGGLISDNPIKTEDVAAVFADLVGRPVLQTYIRPNPLTGKMWAAAHPPGVITIPRLSHVLDLDGGFDYVWSKRFKSTTRTAIRKAEKSGIVVECDTSGKLVPVFYDLMQRSFDRWARQQHEPLVLARWRAGRRDPIHKFQIISRLLGDTCRIYVAWLDNQPAASILVLQGANAHYTRGSMIKDIAGPTRANYLLHRLAIEDACRAGCRYYHMGETGFSTSLAQFKSRFGASAYPYAEYLIERIPIASLENLLRRVAKRLIGFKDV